MSTQIISRKEQTNFQVNPKKFMFWIFLVTIIMLFAAFTSAYIVRKAEGNWEFFNLPQAFKWSCGIVVLGSLFMQSAYFFARRNDLFKLRLFLWITLITGFAFIFSQYTGWTQLVSNKVFLVGNPSGSFVYVISGFHLIHIIGALMFLISTIYSAYRYQIHSKKMLKINLMTTFWHFLGGLWLYLYLFLSLYR